MIHAVATKRRSIIPVKISFKTVNRALPQVGATIANNSGFIKLINRVNIEVQEIRTVASRQRCIGILIQAAYGIRHSVPCVNIPFANGCCIMECISGSWSCCKCKLIRAVATIHGIVMCIICSCTIVCVVLPQIRASGAYRGTFGEAVFATYVQFAGV